MKKKMGILGGLLMAVVVTGYSVAGTYAKYISSFDMADEARVARWSFNDEAEHTVDLFQSSYTYEDNGIVVASKDTSKVIAPGTEGFYEYNVKGTAETNYRVTKNIEIRNKVVLAAEEGAWNDGAIFYNPIVFTIDGTTVLAAPTKVEYENGDPIIVYTVSENDTTVYPANHELVEAGSIAWKWEFESGVENTELGTWSNDSLDTTLGERIYKSLEDGEENRYNITATVGIVVEQTQDAPTYVENGSVVATAKPVIIASPVDKDTNAYVTDTLGIERATYSKVVIKGLALTGTIYASNNGKADEQMGRAASGYYYPLTIKVDPTKVSKITVKDTWYEPAVEKFGVGTDTEYYNNGKVHNSVYDVPADGELSLVLGLKEGTDVEYVLEYVDGSEPTTITLDNQLTFVK